jgi:starch synthase
MRPVRVLSVASEIYPLIKTGGLADVAGALPVALKDYDVDTRTLVPGYPAVMESVQRTEQLLEWPFFGGAARLLSGCSGPLDLFVLDAPHLFARPGNPYLTPEGTDWPDNARRFAALARMAWNIGIGAVPSFVPDVIHSHDWQAALTPAYLHYSGQPWPRTVLTVHNLAYQGRFPPQILEEIDLPPQSFAMDGVEFYGSVGFLKAGLQFADRITTVSPTYAKEIQTEDGGMGLGGLLHSRSARLHGILNGIDTTVWNPETDPAIPYRFNSAKLDDRSLNKTALQHRFGLELSSPALLLGVVSRLSWQKGLDLLAECIPSLLEEGMQLVLLGTGDTELQAQFHAAAHSHPKQVSVLIGYDEDLAHLIQAGSDAIVVPSRFEPCGLTQLCALRYGAVPIVSSVGGLEDTVVDVADEALRPATGFKFSSVVHKPLADTLLRANAFFRDRSKWRPLQQNGMSTDVSWRRSAKQYAQLYRDICDPSAARSRNEGSTR